MRHFDHRKTFVEIYFQNLPQIAAQLPIRHISQKSQIYKLEILVKIDKTATLLFFHYEFT